MRVLRTIIVSLVAFVGATFASAQEYPQGNGTIHFESKLGSVKIYNGTGNVEFSFKGTVLVNGLTGDATITGNVKKEYEARDKKAYFGSGKIKVTGTWKTIQWFGSDITGVWVGHGGIFFYGEYDKDLQTGFFWFDNDVANKQPWRTGGFQQLVPPYKLKNNTPVLRGQKTGG